MRSHPHTDDSTPRPARSAPGADPALAHRFTEALRDIAEDSGVVAELLVHSTSSADTSNTDILQLLVNQRHLVDEAIGVVVARQRVQGGSLAELAPIVKRTQDRLRKKYIPSSVSDALDSRCRPIVTLASATITGTPPLGHPRERLASALTRMKEGSGRRQRELAQKMGVDESYISRMLSGHRPTSWKHVKIICEACDVDPQLMKPLWEVSAGIEPPGTEDPVAYLRTYLRALHYASGSPAPEDVLAAAQHAITADDLDRAMNGPGVPGWQVIEPLALALESLTRDVRPLWRRAQSAAENSARTHS
ncbi:helix-turn-helix domain-containing protein [Streptomyces eurythermus]